jgi:serine/threonine protein kinase
MQLLRRVRASECRIGLFQPALSEHRGDGVALAQGRPLPLDLVLGVVQQVAPALDAIHAAGLVHRDIKPANIMVEQPAWRRAVLLDLGIARAMDSATLTTSGMLIGTPGYLAPEQVDGTMPAGPATDVYQLGATVYALLTGHPPFAGDTAQLLYAIAHRAPPSIRADRPDVAGLVATAIDRALAKDPAPRRRLRPPALLRLRYPGRVREGVR